MSNTPSQNLLNRIRIQKDLEKFTDGIVARHGNIERLVIAITALHNSDQDFIYRWAKSISASDKELSAYFISKAPTAFGLMDHGGVEAWLIAAMDAFDKRGLGFGIEILERLESFAEHYASHHHACYFDKTHAFLEYFVRGLGGRDLHIDSDRTTYTDTDKLYLPEALNLFNQQSANFQLYKLTATHLWAQTWYGTWQYHVLEHLLRDYDLDIALPVFNRLECIRLDACIARDLPGIAREMQTVGCLKADQQSLWRQWEHTAQHLCVAGVGAQASLDTISACDGLALPELKCYQGEMLPHAVQKNLFARVEREKAAMQQSLDNIKRARDTDLDNAQTHEEQPLGKVSLVDNEDEALIGEAAFQLQIDGEAVDMPDSLQELAGSIMQDFGEIPDEHLEPIAAGEYPDDLDGNSGDHLLSPDRDNNGPEVITYREWDYTRQRYRENFCALSEFDVAPGDESFVEETLDKYRSLLKSIKKTFEAVLGESKLQRRQADGDDLDIDAIVESHADVLSGLAMNEYVYTRYQKLDRNIAVMFMIDMSGSTLGWVNDAERESLVLLCEALETLGDRYAIYGFSGRTNKRCEIYRIKNFDQRYDLEVRRRISGIKPKAYTRMGVAIRHLGHLLNQTRARTKLLITLSDGRPEDYGGYKGKYGVEDTRHALLELQRDGIHSFCITIDKEAQDYLPHMYGVANYAVIDEVKKLPYKVADIYRRLTT